MPACEILCVGTELLLGQILNTNSQYLSQELAAIGINCYYQTTIGDNKARIIDAMKRALERADVLLITGGLGPTADDLTTECLAEALQTPLVFDEGTLQRIESFFKARGYKMPESNRKQAYRPECSLALHNPTGTADGVIWEIGQEQLDKVGVRSQGKSRIVMTFPGVPSELKVMWQNTAVPYLKEKFGSNTLWSCELKHYGIGESALAEKYGHLLDNSNPTVAPYAGRGECRLRVTAQGKDLEQAKALAQPVIDEIIRDSGRLCYGKDDDSLESVVAALLIEQNLTVAVAESCTGGWVSKRLTDIPGSSQYTGLNLVTYANEAKHNLLKVDKHILDTDGAVSKACAVQMARGVRELSGADIGVGVTGIAGPGGGTDDKPVGLVFIALADGKDTYVRRTTMPSQLLREEIRFRATSEALNVIRLHLLKLLD